MKRKPEVKYKKGKWYFVYDYGHMEQVWKEEEHENADN